MKLNTIMNAHRIIWFWVFIIVYNTSISNTEKKETVTVNARDGTYIGYKHSVNSLGRELKTTRFLGIPFAEAPVGNLRFKKPKRKEKLSEPYDATQHGPACLQQLLDLGGARKPGVFDGQKMAEDCLTLNIYAPDSGSAPSSQSLPVMIFFHGGGFHVGSPIIYESDVPSAYGNVVIVTISHRLAIWGFLSTGDEHLPGNYGLWDQKMAIEWVHDNIAYFGGDPKQVTLIGMSAGAASVIYQAMFPGNAGMFNRIIPMSGAITCPWAFNPNPLDTTKRLAKLVNCDVTVATKELADCLKSKSSEELEKALNTKENGFLEFPMKFVVTVDGEFVPESPDSLFHGTSEKSKEYREALQSVDLLTGIASEEGMLMLYTFAGVEDTEAFVADRLRLETELVPYVSKIVFVENVPNVINDLIIAEYTNWTDPDNSFNSRQSYVTLGGDFVFNIQQVETALVHADRSNKNTYLYLYDVFPSTRIPQSPSWSTKAGHGDDLTTFFGYNSEDGFTKYTTPYIEGPYEDWETEFIKGHILSFTNFAKTGNPNQPDDITAIFPTTWPKFDTQSQRYLHMTKDMSEESAVRTHLCARATNFWWKALPNVVDAVGKKKSNLEQGGEFCLRDGECGP